METAALPSIAAQPRSRIDALAAHPLPLFVAIFVIFLVVFAASIFLVPRRYGRLIVGDGIYYYVYLRSAVLDGDLDFTNDYTRYQEFNTEDLRKKEEMLSRKTPIGRAANLFSVGPAILWAPAFLVSHGVALVLQQPTDGFSYLYEAPLLLLSIAYGFVGILLIYQVAAGMFSRFAAFVAILGIWLGTNVVYYMGISPSASHVLSLFTSGLFVYLWWRGRNGRRPLAWFVWGLSAGLMALVRWQDVLLAILALFDWIAVWRAETLRSKGVGETAASPRAPTTVESSVPSRSALVGGGVLFVMGMALAFAPQMIAWQYLYGAPLTAPQGSGFFQFTRPEILNVWFSTKRGLFSWTPLVLLAVVGFVPLYLKNRVLGASAVVIFLASSYVNSIVNDWWGGEAFGARRFIGLMPFFALGLAALVEVLRARVSQLAILVILGAFILWNNLFILQYNLWLHGIGHISSEPTFQEMTLDKFTAPFLALRRLFGS